VGAALVLEDAVRTAALDREGVVAVAHRQGLALEAPPLRVSREHPVEVAGEQAGLLPTRSGAHLHDHVLLVVGVGRDHREPDLVLELLEPRLRRHEELAQLGVVAVLGEHFPRALRIRGVGAPLPRELVGGLEGAVRPPHFGVALAVRDHLGVGHLLRELGEAALDLIDELLDHPVKG
jgi:hypothetical protein